MEIKQEKANLIKMVLKVAIHCFHNSLKTVLESGACVLHGISGKIFKQFPHCDHQFSLGVAGSVLSVLLNCAPHKVTHGITIRGIRKLKFRAGEVI